MATPPKWSNPETWPLWLCVLFCITLVALSIVITRL